MRFRAQVVVSLRDGLLDPQGSAVEGSLPALGWTNVSGVRVGRYVRLELDAEDLATAETQVREMSERLLSNPVIETFRVLEVRELGERGAQEASANARAVAPRDELNGTGDA